MRILLANEPRAYREVMAAAVRELRPKAEVRIVEPADLDGEVMRLLPDLVICSRLTEVIETRLLAWVLLYPGYRKEAVVSIAGRRKIAADVELDTLLELIDATEVLAGMS